MTINSGSEDWVPSSCTLPTVEQPVRVAEFDSFFASSVREAARPTKTRLDLVLADGAEPVGRELAARESGCCSFFTFTFDGAPVVMHIDVPKTYVDVLDAFEQRVSSKVAR